MRFVPIQREKARMLAKLKCGQWEQTPVAGFAGSILLIDSAPRFSSRSLFSSHLALSPVPGFLNKSHRIIVIIITITTNNHKYTFNRIAMHSKSPLTEKQDT